MDIFNADIWAADGDQVLDTMTHRLVDLVLLRRGDPLIQLLAVVAAGEVLMGVPSIPTTHQVPPCWVRP